MTVKEAKIILLCNNFVDLFFAQSKGVFSKKTLDLDNDVENIDLEKLKEEALPIILNHLDKQEQEINKLNNAIDRMAKEIKDDKELIEGWKSDLDNKNIKEIKEYFMEDKE